MNAIIGMVELTLRSPKVDPSTRDYLVTAKDSAHTLLGLVDDLLDFSRMESGRFELDAEPFDLRRTLDNTMRTLSLRAHARGLELVCRVGSAVPDRLEGDHRRLRQIVTNLVANAIKFTPQGEVVVSVDLSPQSPARGPNGHPAPVELLLSVRDTGIGISREDQERIFRPFTQVDASLTREQTGAGLGLTICKELVEKMGGRIRVESELGKGTTFWCTLLLTALPDAPSVTAISSPDWQGRKVLVVDDNSTTLRTMDEFLAHWGFEVRTAGSAREALAVVEAAHSAGGDFDVLFVDALMPDVDGLSLVEDLRKRGLAPPVTLVLGSMADRDIHGERLKELEIAGAIEKPISQSALFDTLAATLEGPIEGDRGELFSDRTTRPLEVLVAEDTPPNQKVVKAILEHRGHHVRIAQNGREALDKAAAEHFDVILMDVQMPTMDGLQATTAIRQLPDEPRSRVPIVALTAHAMKRDRERCLSAGMNGYISKPIDAETLIRVVEDLGNRSRPDSHAVPPNPRGTWIMTTAPASQTAAGDEPPVNLARALDRMGGDRSLLVEMARFYLEDTPGLLDTLRTSLQEQKAEEATRAAHSLKGLSANFDAHAAVQAALAVETASRSGDLARASALFADLQGHLNEVSEILRRELKP
jgi:two-component system sensor histidine kinase/response regulator